MAGFGVGRVLAAVVVVAAVGGGLFVWKAHEENRRQALKVESQKAQAAKARAEGSRAETEARENAKAKESAARAEESRRKIAEADRAKAEAKAEERKAEAAAAREKAEAAKAETAKAKARKEAAEAETKKAAAQKAASEAAAAEQAKRAEAESLALKRAEAERQKADAEYATAAAVKRAAEAAREKSENERKAAEANAAAERDRKLRMYQRAGTSRAELLALKNAEKRLALEESGVVVQETAPEAEQEAERTETPAASTTNAVVAVKWPEEADALSEADAVAAQLNDVAGARSRLRERGYVLKFEGLAEKAESEGRATDAARLRATIPTFVPDYVGVYMDFIREANVSGRVERAQSLLSNLLKTVPDWKRADVLVHLLEKDEALYSGLLAGRVPKAAYVAAFRKIYDRTRRDVESDTESGRDPRAEKMQRIRDVLSKYVPDYEKIYEWSGTYSADKDD